MSHALSSRTAKQRIGLLLAVLLSACASLQAQLTEADTLKWNYRLSANGSWIAGNVERLLLVGTADFSTVNTNWALRSSSRYQYDTLWAFHFKTDLMILKKNFSPAKVWLYIRRQMYFVIGWSTAVWLLFALTGYKALALNFTPIGVLGSALAIFVAFRNNSAYGRWWEARTLWGGIVNSSRVLARLAITFTDSHAHQAQYDRGRSEAFKRDLVYKCIAWVHALRLHLRQQEDWETIRPLLPEHEHRELIGTQNKPAYLQLMIGRKIYEAMGNGTLGGFDSFQMEGQLLALANYQGGCERIKNTPLPRQYDFFTRVFVLLFALLLPFGLLGFFAAAPFAGLSWLVVPLSVLIAGVFVIMERTGAANEDPFENRVTDVPLTSLCNTIERDLREMLGEQTIPEKLLPKDGYLF